MNFEFLEKRRELISILFLVLSGIFCLLIIIKVSGFYTSMAGAEDLIAQAKARGENDPNAVREYFDKRKQEAEELVKKNLFSPPPPKRHPIQRVTGILGNTALINGKWHKEGDKIGDAKVLEITPTYVKAQWEGEEKIFSPFDTDIGDEKQDEDEEQKGEKKAEQKEDEAKETSNASEEDPLAWMGVKLSPAVREKFLKQWNSMSEEQRQRAREEWNRMSEDEKQEAVERMEENM